MPVTIKSAPLKYKNSSGEFVGINAIAEASTAQQLAAISQAGAAQIAAIEADVAHSPIIGDNGNWFTWDVDEQDYVDSGEPSRGIQGPVGPQGAQGEAAPAASVTTAVDAYLAENFTNPDSPPLDRTLLSSSSAAPADLVGDLKTAITVRDESLEVTWDSDSTNKYINAGGVIGTLNGWNYSNLISVFEGSAVVSFSYGGGDNIRIHGYNALGNWVKQLGYHSGASGVITVNCTIDSGIKAIRISTPIAVTNFTVQNIQTAKTTANKALTNTQKENLLLNPLSSNVIYNIFDKTKITEGYYKKASDGTIGTVATWFYSDLMPVEEGKSYFVSGFNNSQIAFYANEGIASFVGGYTVSFSGLLTVTAPPGANYMVISQAISDAPNIYITKDYYNPSKENNYESIKNIKAYLPMNLFDSTTITTGKYKRASDGGIGSASTFFFSDLIPVTAGEKLIVSKIYQDQIAFYADANVSSFITGSGLAPEGTLYNYEITVPQGAKYMTISGRTEDLSTLWIARDFAFASAPNNQSLIKTLDTRYIKKEEIVIEVGSSGYDYTSVLAAVEYIRNNGIANATVKIHPGTYDLIAELVALRGQTFIDNYTQSEYTSPTGLKGLFLGNGIKIIGDNPANTTIVCRYTGNNASFKGNWSVFHVYNNEFTLKNVSVIANAVRYCLHDDGRVAFGTDIGIIENCNFLNEFLQYGALIGAGLWGDAVRYIRNCQFINNQSDQAGREAISYHPNTGSNACEVHIDNIYCENCGVNIILGENAAGVSTAYVSNSKMNRLPYVNNPTSEYQDMKLIYWNIEVET